MEICYKVSWKEVVACSEVLILNVSVEIEEILNKL
jgi:hypothetical protein